MSRIGRKAIPVPSGVKVNINGRRIETSGPKGTLEWEAPPEIKIEHDSGANEIRVERLRENKSGREKHGMSRALIANMVRGVHEAFERRLLIYGTGYGCDVQGKTLNINAGYMGRGLNRPAQFQVPIPDGLEVVAEVKAARGDSDPAKLLIRGCDKQQVGAFAADVRKIRTPEPYKGKGIRYDDETVRRKQGKAFGS
jgi:large subunit ribosomal protein L6